MNSGNEDISIEDGLIGLVVGLTVGLGTTSMLTWYVDEILYPGFSYDGHKLSMLFVGKWAIILLLYAVGYAIISGSFLTYTSIDMKIIRSFIFAIFGSVNVVILIYLFNNFSGSFWLAAIIISCADIIILIFASIVLTKAVHNAVENIKRNKRNTISTIALIGVILLGYHLVEQYSIEQPLSPCIESADRKNITNSIGMEFIQIPACGFYMGSEQDEPIHKVMIAKEFYIGQYEVTQKQWRDVMENNPSYFKGDDLPVENVTWHDVQEFIKKLNEKENTNKYHLPSEAEWEYVARAGTTTTYFFGDDESKLKEYAWYGERSDGKTHPVGQKKPNPWGLYDIYGNVWEWVQDKWHEGGYNGAPTDGSAWESCPAFQTRFQDGSCSMDSGNDADRVIRGGAWFDDRIYEPSSAERKIEYASNHFNIIGFRLVRDL